MGLKYLEMQYGNSSTDLKYSFLLFIGGKPILLYYSSLSCWSLNCWHH